MTERRKNKTITIYVDQKYEDKLLYLKHTTGITAFFESALDNMKVDEAKLDMVKQIVSKK